jgi:hypothetical protein
VLRSRSATDYQHHRKHSSQDAIERVLKISHACSDQRPADVSVRRPVLEKGDPGALCAAPEQV